MTLVEVKNKRDSVRFIEFPVKLYAKEKNYIRPLDTEIAEIFDPKKNSFYEKGDCIRWLLVRNNEVIGRIAAFVLLRESKNTGVDPSGGIGFFECIDEEAAANALFDSSKKWLNAKGAAYMDGPVNFGARDKWWGLLTKGYDLEPNYQCNYNFPYYKKLFEKYGFETYFEYYTFLRPIKDDVNPRLQRKADLINRNPDYTFDHFKKDRFLEQTNSIIDMYNRAWVNHEGVTAITREQGHALMNKLKPILDEKIIWFAYYKGEPVAFYINIPEVNQWFKHVNGKLNAIGIAKFAWHKFRKKNKKMLGFVFGVVPEHQGKGLDGGLIHAFHNMAKSLSNRYEVIEINGIGDFNRKMIIVVKQVGGEICKIHTTYRYLFDRDKPFERMKAIK
ncbi:hypothetical protein [Eudoraea chungangensis]|uniref:hypothetical protein n=1 Tax=Eudoraea chungangensis TaxID=1481905 RepID=UPI0023EB79F3|nr:hypothetical protein [Eudoraea chungangensis]